MEKHNKGNRQGILKAQMRELQIPEVKEFSKRKQNQNALRRCLLFCRCGLQLYISPFQLTTDHESAP
ncbi:hypothetical protein AMECASPLE_006607 [Ameca splendens]|uniref:60S ribosomal protein L29 n=1 Tax=Ameca splendens TaxID=208324 RepID=A0ABV0ZJ92_9TELE